MFEKEIKELFELAWRVSNETDYFVSFDIASHVHACDINIMNSKWDSGKKMDGNYKSILIVNCLKRNQLSSTNLQKHIFLDS